MGHKRQFVAASLIMIAMGAGAAAAAPNTPSGTPTGAPKPAAGATVAPKEKDKEQDVVVGVAGPMSGQFAFIGEQMKRGAQQAIDDINAKGGVLGKKLKLVVVDDGCDAQKATAVAGDLVKQKAVLVVGHFCSAASIQAST